MKRRIKALTEVDGSLQSLYEKAPDGNGFVLKLEDDDSSGGGAGGDTETKAKLDEFRENNRKLHAQMQQMQAQLEAFKGIDPERMKIAFDALANVEKLEEAEAIKAGKFEEVVARRVTAVRTEFERQLKAKEDHLKTLEQQFGIIRNRLAATTIETTILGAVNKAGKLKAGAAPDVLARAHRIWHLDDPEKGKLVAKNGDEPVFGSKGDPITPDEWATSLISEAPHLFESGGGGGAGGGTKGSGGGGGRVISASDPKAFSANIEKIASGEVVVAGTV